MANTTQETLEQFGAEFQTKVLSALIQDRPFVEQTVDIINPEFFEADSSQWITTTLLDYFAKYRKLPTASVFKIEMEKIPDDVLKVGVQQQLRNVGKHLSDTDLAYVKDKFLHFCKNQKLKGAIITSVDLLEQHRYDEIKVQIDEAMRAGVERNYGHNWKVDIDKRLIQVARKTISTPWECINTIMDGGLGGGELGCIMAPSGAGKSWMLACLGASAMKAGKKILQFTLELNDTYSGLRYDTIFTGIEPKELRNNYDAVKRIVDGVPGEIVIKYFPAKTASSNRFYAHIQQMEAIGFKPDLLIIDYADLMLENGHRSKERHLELGAIYVELRSLAGEMDIPCWTASQTQRSSITEEIIQADKIAESYQKVMTADFVMSLSRTLEDKPQNTARVHIIKNRFGPDGMTYPAHMNVLKGQLDVYEETSSQGIATRQSMNEGSSMIKQMLQKRLKDHQSDLG